MTIPSLATRVLYPLRNGDLRTPSFELPEYNLLPHLEENALPEVLSKFGLQ